MRKTLLLLFISIYVANSQNAWKKTTIEKNILQNKQIKPVDQLPDKFSAFSLDLAYFKTLLTLKGKGLTNKILLPDVDNKISEFSFIETSNFTEPLSEAYGFIKSYTITKISDKKTTGKLSIGNDGVHITLYSLNHPTYYLDPYTTDNSTYILYSREHAPHKSSKPECNLLRNHDDIKQKKHFGSRLLNDGMLRTYRLALACTGEYSQFHVNNQGIRSGTEAEQRAAVLSAMNTTMTRVNGVYEKELSIHMNIVVIGGENPLINLNPATDNLDNDSPGLLINQNQELCDTVIGTTNYDLGHVFALGVGGIAFFRSVCLDGDKATAMTGLNSPIGDPFDIDFVAHEIGHQFGANHTFNGDTGSCDGINRNDETAVEPGSGSTIMAYAGICSPNNVQNNSDDYFHTISIQEILGFVQNNTPCSVNTTNGNTSPTANAGLDYAVPKGTPLILRGTGSDNDAKANLTYSWEQTDNEFAFSISPPVATNTIGASFRSFRPSTSPERYLPKLTTIVSGEFSTIWEVLPEVAREMNFTLTVRDNQPEGGATSTDQMKITVVDINPFIISTPNSEVSWDGATIQTITWNKSTTDQAPVNCKNVRIKLSTDGGLTFPTTIVESTPNDGIQNIIIPNLPTTEARIMIEAVDNIFYNVNSTNFTIINNPNATIGDVTDFANLSLFPNPTSNKSFNLIFDIEPRSNISIQLFDLRGRLVDLREFSNETNKFAEQIHYETVTPGLYLLQIIKNDKKETRKVIIK